MSTDTQEADAMSVVENAPSHDGVVAEAVAALEKNEEATTTTTTKVVVIEEMPTNGKRKGDGDDGKAVLKRLRNAQAQVRHDKAVAGFEAMHGMRPEDALAPDWHGITLHPRFDHKRCGACWMKYSRQVVPAATGNEVKRACCNAHRVLLKDHIEGTMLDVVEDAIEAYDVDRGWVLECLKLYVRDEFLDWRDELRGKPLTEEEDDEEEKKKKKKKNSDE
jgi:hypothetical protein